MLTYGNDVLFGTTGADAVDALASHDRFM